jgi:hypothetical protein
MSSDSYSSEEQEYITAETIKKEEQIAAFSPAPPGAPPPVQTVPVADVEAPVFEPASEEKKRSIMERAERGFQEMIGNYESEEQWIQQSTRNHARGFDMCLQIVTQNPDEKDKENAWGIIKDEMKAGKVADPGARADAKRAMNYKFWLGVISAISILLAALGYITMPYIGAP